MSLLEKLRRLMKTNNKTPEDFDENLETAQQYKERWRSIYVVYFTMFIMSLGFSIIVTGVWPYLDKLDPSAGKEFMGFIVAANPFGQMIFSPLVGWWSNRLGSIRIPLIFSLLLFTVASGIYSCLELFDGHIKHWMLWSRFLVGVSSDRKIMPFTTLTWQVLAMVFIFDLIRGQLISYRETENPKRGRSLKGQFKYCGHQLEHFLHSYCTTFNSPEARRRRRSIVNECCKESCSIWYILTNYCQVRNKAKIQSDFGTLDVESTTIADGYDMLESVMSSSENVRTKKHARHQRRKKRQCTCKKNRHHTKKEQMVLSRTVPEYVIGFTDHTDNEPIIFASSL